MTARNRSLPNLFRGLVALTAIGVAAGLAPAEQLPFDTRGNALVVGSIASVGDVDEYGVDMLPGDRLICRVREAGPARGISATIALFAPNGSDTGVFIRNQGTFRPSFTFVADAAGTHRLRVEGDPGGFAGSTGNYSVFVRVRRFRQRPTFFAETDGGAISSRFFALAGSVLNMRANTRRGGFDVTDLTRPDSTSEPEFANALIARPNRKFARLRNFALTGETGAYRIIGDYDAGSRVRVSAILRPPRGRVRARLGDEEPDFDPFIRPFPNEGVTGTRITVIADNLVTLETRRGVLRPSFAVGGVVVDDALVEQPGNLEGVYQFPIPPGLAVDAWHDVTLRNPDGQSAISRDAFFYVPAPTASGFSPTEAGPAGGRTLTITGQNIRGGTVVIFDGVVVQPSATTPTTVTVKAPPHAPGSASLVIRDEFQQTAAVPGTLTYLDITSNRIDSITPGHIQALGGETITVDGADFGTDTVLRLDGEDIPFTRVSDTQLTFDTDARAAETLELRVEDQFEQPSTLQVDVRGLTDASTQIIPAPRTVANSEDSFRATSILSGDIDGVNGDDLVLFRPATAFGNDIFRSRVRLLLADGNGGFTDDTEARIPAISAVDDHRARGATLIDADRDGDLDIAFITPDELDDGDRSSLRLFLNDGDGFFTDDTENAIPSARLTIEDMTVLDHNQGVAIVAADVDGVNGDDLVILHTDFFQETEVIGDPSPDPNDPPPPTVEHFYPGLRVLLNDGNGVFTRDDDALPEFDDTDVTQFQGTALAYIDSEPDGDPDLIITRDQVIEFPADSGTFVLTATFLRNDGGTFVDDSVARLPAASNPDFLHGDRIVFADSDGDGDDDMWVLQNTPLVNPVTAAVSTDPAARLYLNTGGVFARAGAGVLPGADRDDSLQCDDLTVGDLNGDGEVEVVLLSANPPNPGERGMRILRGSASGAFVRTSIALPNPNVADDGSGNTLLLLDTDDDGDLDVVFSRDVPNAGKRATRVFLNPRN